MKPAKHTKGSAAREPRRAAPQRVPGADLADQAHARIEEMVVTLELPPGSVWSELELSERLGIGRTPVREALQRLESDHLIQIVPRFGARVTEIDVMQQLLLLELRRELERLVAVTAARRSTADERTELMRMAKELAKFAEGDVLPYLRLHYNVKRFMAECARNPYVARAIAPSHAMSRRFYYLHYRKVHDVPVAAATHVEVIRAVVMGDETAAAAASDRMMDYVEKITRATVLSKF